MLKTVNVPKEFEPIFIKAQEYVSKYFAERKEDAQQGTIEIFGQRYIFVRAASMSVEFFEMIKNTYRDESEEEALSIARSLLFDIAHAIGVADARNFHTKMDLQDPISKLSAGPIHFSHSGWAFVDIFPESRPTPDENFYLLYDHPYSFESDSWIKAKKKVDFPVCVMNAGYSSGWCEESFGIKLVASEIFCKAKGDKHCRFIMGPPGKIEGYIEAYLKKQPSTGKKITNYKIPGFFSRKKAEDELKRTLAELELRVEQRTADLSKANDLLQTSEKRFRALIEKGKDVINLLGADGRILYTSPSSENVLGYTADEIKEMNSFDFYHPDDLSFVKSEFSRLLEKKGRSGTIEFRLRHKEGTWRWVESTATNLLDEPSVQAIVTNYRDITDRKKTEIALAEAHHALTESEQQYRALVEQSANPVYILIKSRVVLVNAAWEKLFGYAREEAYSPEFDYLKLVAPESLALAQDRMSKRASGEWLPSRYEMRALTRDGSPIDLEVSVAVITWHNQAAVQGVYYDITERKRAEQVLAAEKEQLSVTLRSIGDGVITTDVHGKIILINRVAEKLTGWNLDEAIGHSIEDVFRIVNQDTRERLENPITKIVQAGGIFELEHQTALVAKDGSEKLIADSGAPIRDKDNNIIGVVLVFRDITDKQKIEQERVKALKLESVGLLAGGIAHDFNNILTAILGNLSLAKLEAQSSTKERLFDILEKSEKACIRAKELTQQLLTFSRGGAPVLTTASIEELIRDSSEFMVRGSNVRCEYAIAKDLWPVEVDQGQISQVIHNLIINSVQAMPQGGVIRVQAENLTMLEDNYLSLKKGDYVRISVTDHGTGIPEEYVQKIFDPYFTTKQKGSGLGLATCYSIIKNHNGQITMESELGVGTTFHIFLPVSTNVLSVKKSGVIPLTGPDKGRILVMDDEEDIRSVTLRLLTRFGYDAEGAADGDEAVRMYKEAKSSHQPFNAVIMDLTIPGGMGGKEAIRKLLEIDPKAKVIVSSGYSNDPIVANFKEFGFSGFLVKPFKMEDLRILLHALLTENN